MNSGYVCAVAHNCAEFLRDFGVSNEAHMRSRALLPRAPSIKSLNRMKRPFCLLTTAIISFGCASTESAEPTSAFAAELSACARWLPDPQLTPGALCTPSDPNFKEYRYAERIPYCNRNVTSAEKDAIAGKYNVAPGTYSQYEFDHLIPLAAGGSNSPENLWPQPIADAHIKDALEQRIYNQMAAGTLTQA